MANVYYWPKIQNRNRAFRVSHPSICRMISLVGLLVFLIFYVESYQSDIFAMTLSLLHLVVNWPVVTIYYRTAKLRIITTGEINPVPTCKKIKNGDKRKRPGRSHSRGLRLWFMRNGRIFMRNCHVSTPVWFNAIHVWCENYSFDCHPLWPAA